jgi:hypothetical protein
MNDGKCRHPSIEQSEKSAINILYCKSGRWIYIQKMTEFSVTSYCGPASRVAFFLTVLQMFYEYSALFVKVLFLRVYGFIQ